MADINTGSMHQSIIKSFDEVSESLKTTIVNAEVAIDVSAVADYAAEAGTTGEALANAGGAGNPWDALLVANQDPGTFGEYVQKLLTTVKFLGLK